MAENNQISNRQKESCSMEEYKIDDIFRDYEVVLKLLKKNPDAEYEVRSMVAQAYEDGFDEGYDSGWEDCYKSQ